MYKFDALADDSSYQTWMDVAHEGLRKTLKDPSKITHSNSRETFCLSARINFYKSDGTYIKSRMIQAIIGDRDFNIISTYPSDGDKPCS